MHSIDSYVAISNLALRQPVPRPAYGSELSRLASYPLL